MSCKPPQFNLLWGRTRNLTKRNMAESLMNPPKQDKTPVWLKNKHGVVSVWPAHVANGLLKDKNKGFEITEAEFVPKRSLRPFDEGKSNQSQKNANAKSYKQFEEMLAKSLTELKQFAKENNLDYSGLKTKKE